MKNFPRFFSYFVFGASLLAVVLIGPRKTMYLIWLKVDPVSAVASINSHANSQLSYGQDPGFLTLSALVERGYGHCGSYVSLLANELSILGVPYKIYGTLGSRAIHSVVEVDTGGEKVVADPTLGVIYPHSLFSLLDKPILSSHSIGDLSDESAAPYYAERFFSQISLLSTDVGLDQTYLDKAFFDFNIDDDKVSVSWKPGLKVDYIDVRPLIKMSIRINEDSDPVELRGADSYKVYVGSGKNSAEFFLAADEKLSEEDVTLGVVIQRIADEKTLPVNAPLATYIGFEGGRALIDTVSLVGNSSGKTYFFMDLGDLKSEQTSTSYLRSEESPGKRLQNWGAVSVIEEKDYRLVDSSLGGEFGHSVIQFSPVSEGLESDSGFEFLICYLKDGGEDATRVKVYNLRNEQYDYIGRLRETSTRACDAFPVMHGNIASTLGQR